MPIVDPSLLAFLLVLAGAAGADLGLAILILAVAPAAGWSAPPGTLPLLDTPAVMFAGVAMYVAEAVVERHPTGFSVWHAFQRWVRLMALVLLAAMGTAGLPGTTRLLLGVAMVVMGSGSYVVTSGWQAMVVLRRLPRESQLLAALAQDVAFAALLILALDRPLQAAVGAAALLLLAASRIPLAIRAHRAVVEAGRSWLRALLDPGDWVAAEEVPPGVPGALPEEERPPSPPRGTRALFLTRDLTPGWLLVASGRAWYAAPGQTAAALARRPDGTPPPDPLHARLFVTVEGRSGELLVRRDGPSQAELEREIPLSASHEDTWSGTK
jgi:hypothetical protein